MKILIIGDENSLHIYTFIRVVLDNLEDIEITLLDMSTQKDLNSEAYFYYKNSDKVKLISNNRKDDLVSSSRIRKIPKISTLIYLYRLRSKILKLGEFDVTLIHFVTKIKAILILSTVRSIGKIIPIFWGSDLLRNKDINNKPFSNLFKISNKIILNTDNMLENFRNKIGNDFDKKLEVVKFPVLSFHQIDQLEKDLKKSDIFDGMQLPQDKIIIMCGHSGFEQEQHEKLINAISKCNKSILNKCYFIFPMTYGLDDLISLQTKVSQLLKNKNIDGKVLNTYLAKEDMLKLIMCSNIYISVIATDAFSAVMQENLYTGSIVVYGEWLNYYELDNNGIYSHSVKNTSDITKVLEHIVDNFESEVEKAKNNKDLIYNISAPNAIRRKWVDILS